MKRGRYLAGGRNDFGANNARLCLHSLDLMTAKRNCRLTFYGRLDDTISAMMIPGQVAHHSGMKPPSHSEIIPPTVPI
jgi:hypothetical protein